MKLFLNCIAISTLLFLAHCKSTKNAPAKAAEAISNAELETAQKKWPNTLVAELNEGQEIYRTKCTRCHGMFEITGFSEKKWLHEIDDMSPKADLTPQEKLKLTKHILSYREANLQPKSN